MKKQYIRAEVEHFEFATALISRLDGGPDKVRIKVAFQAYPNLYENNIATLSGVVFECCQFLEFINGSYDATDLKTLNSESQWAPKGFKKPENFIVEAWEMVENPYNWRLVEKTHFEGVKWLMAEHTGDGGDRCCAGYAKFSYEKTFVEGVSDGIQVKIDGDDKYPTLALPRYLARTLN